MCGGGSRHRNHRFFVVTSNLYNQKTNSHIFIYYCRCLQQLPYNHHYHHHHHQSTHQKKEKTSLLRRTSSLLLLLFTTKKQQTTTTASSPDEKIRRGRRTKVSFYPIFRRCAAATAAVGCRMPVDSRKCRPPIFFLQSVVRTHRHTAFSQGVVVTRHRRRFVVLKTSSGLR